VILFHLFGGKVLRFSSWNGRRGHLAEDADSSKLRQMERRRIAPTASCTIRCRPRSRYALTEWGQSLLPGPRRYWNGRRSTRPGSGGLVLHPSVTQTPRIVRKSDLTCFPGEDLIQERCRSGTLVTASYAPRAAPAAFNRFCSADLPALSAFYDAASGEGHNGRLFMNGEEAGSEGRAFCARTRRHELELLGWGSSASRTWSQKPGDENTLVAETGDSTPGKVTSISREEPRAGRPWNAPGSPTARSMA